MKYDVINRQTAIDALCDNCETVDSSCAHYPCKRYLAIENLPSAQLEIIRRRDCKYYDPYDSGKAFYCHKGIDWCYPDDFCSYAEREEDA